MSLPHCVAMCGPYAAFACTASARAGQRPTLRFLLGRAAGYAAMGVAVGASGHVVVGWLPPRWSAVALSVTLGLGMLSLAWRLMRPGRDQGALVPLRLGRAQADDARSFGLATRSLGTSAPDPARAPSRPSSLARLATSATALGALMAIFPCGALYSTMLVAAGTASAWAGAAVLLGFALASSLALGVSGWVARLSTAMDLHTRRVLGVALVVGAVVLVARPLTTPDPSGGPSCHEPGASP
ncbi:MAG: sulfite exporter TauE/SafE family protein [Sandaracinaceae bacterium]|nr:sulfite exporter TauE/SafE family protein [Sandaracinaceae bacterium]